jgi:AcrR family transcriptional regulator
MPRAGLDRDRVVTTAAALADERGLSALTLSGLAERLGVRPPSLYAHVGGLDELRRELAADGTRRLSEKLADAAAGRAGSEALAAIADAYRAFAAAHPGRYAALQPAGDREDPSARRIVSLLVAVLEGYGYAGEDAIHAVRAVRAALHGFVTLERDGGFGLAVDIEESFHRLVALLDDGLRGRRG